MFTRNASSPTASRSLKRRHRFGDPRSRHTPVTNRVTMAMAGLLACASLPKWPRLPGFPVACGRASGSAPTVAGAATDLVPDGYAAPCSLLLPSAGNHHRRHGAPATAQGSSACSTVAEALACAIAQIRRAATAEAAAPMFGYKNHIGIDRATAKRALANRACTFNCLARLRSRRCTNKSGSRK